MANEANAPGVNPMSLAGRNIVVTGAGQGIGLAIARLAAGLGASLTLIDMNAEGLAAAAGELGEERVLTAVGSVCDPPFIEEAVARSAERFGGIHGLVNNAGITRTAMIDKMTLGQWREVIDVHLTGAFICLQAVGRVMVAQAREGRGPAGSVVNISSDAGRQGTMGQINYGTAKAGILGTTMSAAREWAKYGIRVNSVAFGVVETPMTETIRGERFRDTYLSRIPMGRWCEPHEAAGPVCFLLSDAASFVTGQHLSANGGSHMSG